MRELLHFCYDSLECFRIVDSKVGKHFAVDFDSCFVEIAHELRVGKTFQTSGSVDSLNPESAEGALFVATVTESVG